MAGKVLIVDDEPEALENCRRILTRLRYDCVTTDDPRRALDLIAQERPGLVLTDLCMPEVDGLAVLQAAKAQHPDTPVVLMTAYASVETAVGSMRHGALDYLQKPFSSAELEEVARRAFAGKHVSATVADTSAVVEPSDTPALSMIAATGAGAAPAPRIVGQSAGMRKVLELIRKVGSTNANVLIYGESGTGKELVARAVHAGSPRAGRPFVPVDCAAIADTLLESELFGHEKGAFTGAHAAKSGLFEAADGGTIFLDEVAAMSPMLQARLLRVLQERQVRPVGATRFRDVDVRVVAASNRDLEEACRRGEFRSDLYYRLNVIQIALPPLRDREGDVPLLADALLARVRAGRAGAPVGFSPEAMALLTRYDWPGNVRELQNVVERAAALADGPLIEPVHLPERFQTDAGALAAAASYKDAKRHVMRSFERNFLLELLRRHHGNMRRAAQEAGVDRKTIERMVKKHGLRRRAEFA